MNGRSGSWIVRVVCALAATFGARPSAAQAPEATPNSGAPAEVAPAPAPAPALAPADVPAAQPAPAAEPAPFLSHPPEASELELFDLEASMNGEIASASKFAQHVSEAPGIVSSIARRQIHDFGWLTLSEVLFAQPGFFPSHDYERVTVGARGLWESWNNNHLLLLIDGVPFNDTETGGAYTWEITPLAFAKSVEVIRGPGSALYGTNATNGVVAINTLSAEDLPDEIGEASLRVGNAGTRRVDLLAGAKNSRFSVLASFTSYLTQGNSYSSLDASGRTDAAGNLQSFTVQDGRRSNYFFAKLDAHGFLEGLSLQLHYQDFEYELGHGWYFVIPDTGEFQREARQILALSYKHGTEDGIRQEYTLRYGRHHLFHDVRFLPNGSYEGFYPAGVTEDVKTHFDDLFARAQVSHRFVREIHALAGVEYAGFFYGGDDFHQANADVASPPDYSPRPGPAPLGPYYEWILDHPVTNVGAFGQLVSGKALGSFTTLTLGLRYDRQFFDFTDLSSTLRPTLDKHFDQFSPRAALVFTPLQSLTLKALAGRAFRAPAPLELFGANTWLVGSNLFNLKPEVVTTYELAADWKATSFLTARVNGFWMKFENQIAYGPNNVLTNYYTKNNAGLEAELLAAKDFGARGALTAYANYSYVKQLSETIQVEGILPSDQLTWAPSHTAKAGVSYSLLRFTGSAQLLYQGAVERRASDQVSYPDLRPATVPAFTTVGAYLAYKPLEWLAVSLRATNLLDSKGYLVKGGDFPFDYQIEGRRVLAGLELNL